ncbi:MAG: ThiF family adenylyltransferase [Candidatus Bathyarchaeia archaeon]
MKVTAKIPSVKKIEFEVTPKITVDKLKRLICERLGLEPNLTKILLDGKPLKENTPLSKYKRRSLNFEVDYLWSRQLILWDTKGQAALNRSKVLIAGAGAVGNEVAKNLAMLGVGRLIIVDYDTVEVSNLSRMIFFSKEDSGKPKSTVLAEALHRKYPHIEVTAIQGRLEKIPLRTFLESDIILSSLDNFASRAFLTSICRRYMVPMVDAGVMGYQCRVQSYIPPNDPCLACPIPPNQYGRMLGLRNPCDAPVEDAKVPSLSTSISLVASLQSHEAVKIILGYRTYLEEGRWPEVTGEPMRGIWIADVKHNKYSIVKLSRNKECVICGEHGEARDTVMRLDVPLKTFESTSQDKVFKKILPDFEEMHIFKLSRLGMTPIGEVKPLKKELRRGDYLRVTFKRRAGEYNEAIIKLI